MGSLRGRKSDQLTLIGLTDLEVRGLAWFADVETPATGWCDSIACRSSRLSDGVACGAAILLGRLEGGDWTNT